MTRGGKQRAAAASVRRTTARPYHRPPDGYRPPEHCRICGIRIIFVPVIGGHKWSHLTAPPPMDTHNAKPDVSPWWDVSTGEWVDDNPIRRSGPLPAPQEGLTPNDQ